MCRFRYCLMSSSYLVPCKYHRWSDSLFCLIERRFTTCFVGRGCKSESITTKDNDRRRLSVKKDFIEEKLTFNRLIIHIWRYFWRTFEVSLHRLGSSWGLTFLFLSRKVFFFFSWWSCKTFQQYGRGGQSRISSVQLYVSEEWQFQRVIANVQRRNWIFQPRVRTRPFYATTIWQRLVTWPSAGFEFTLWDVLFNSKTTGAITSWCPEWSTHFIFFLDQL